MKKSRALSIFVVIFILIGSIPAGAASLSETAANQPWTIQTIDNDEPGIQNLSAAFVGSNQVPMLMYTKPDSNRVYYVHLATEAIPGNCGPNDAWFCGSYGTYLVESTLSNLITVVDAPNFCKVSYAFVTDDDYLHATSHYNHDDMTEYGGYGIHLVDLTKFGDVLIGAPSLQVYEDKFRIAFSIVDFSDPLTPPQYKLIYVHHTDQKNNSCRDDWASNYHCDVIETTGYTLGPPSLQVSSNGSVGIAYELDNNLRYAYPHDHTIVFPSNCGPGDPKTWRCITIYESAVGSDVKLDFGQTQGRGIVYTYYNNLMVAQYVGSGGNCGEDGSPFNPTNKWECMSLASLVYTPNPSYSIAVDPQGYLVIANDAATNELVPKSLFLQYPLGHVGLEPVDSWRIEVIDPSPHWEVDNGGQAAIAINNNGLGFIAYIQDDDYYYVDRLKIAYQQFRNYLPITLH